MAGVPDELRGAVEVHAGRETCRRRRERVKRRWAVVVVVLLVVVVVVEPGLEPEGRGWIGVLGMGGPGCCWPQQQQGMLVYLCWGLTMGLGLGL